MDDPKKFRLLLDFEAVTASLVLEGGKIIEFTDLNGMKKIHRGLGLLIRESEPPPKIPRIPDPRVPTVAEVKEELAAIGTIPPLAEPNESGQRRFDLQVPVTPKEEAE